MGSIGFGELTIVFLLIFLLFGPKQIPKIVKGIKHMLGEWTKIKGDIEESVKEVDEVVSEATGLNEVRDELNSVSGVFKQKISRKK